MTARVGVLALLVILASVGAIGWAANPGHSTGLASSSSGTQFSLAASSPPSLHGSWSLLSTTLNPPNATGSVVVYDAADRTIVDFGGRTSWASGYDTNTAETWILSAKGAWKQIHPNGHPPASWEAAAAYDPVIGGVVMFGGEKQVTIHGGSPTTVLLNQTWIYTKGSWSKVAGLTISPSARFEASMAYDPALRAVVMFGGLDGMTSHGGAQLNDTWEFNGTSWIKLHPASSPPGRRLASMTYDAATKSLLLFGGCPAGSCGLGLNDTWQFQSGTWTKVTPSTSPQTRLAASMTFDPATHSVILFGGLGTTDYNDTWAYSGSSWTLLCSTCAPPARGGASMTYDSALGAAVMLGGGPAFGAPGALVGTWLFA